MADLEKVIKGLEWHIRELAIGKSCYQCPYVSKQPCETTLMTDVLALLKEQEPRVMTLEELKNSLDCPCWFESHGTYMGEKGFWIIPYMFSVTGMMSYVFPLMQTDERGNTHYSELGTYVYGKVWRCWTSRPTDEQREAVKWDE